MEKNSRNLIIDGKVEQYKSKCEHFYKINGIVVHGAGIGRSVGMPTANIAINNTQVLPKDGVYGALVKINNINKTGVVNIGARPSVDNDNRKTIEVHILDFNQDIYGKEIQLEICFRIRDIIKFNNIKEVKAQVEKDIQENQKRLSDISKQS